MTYDARAYRAYFENDFTYINGFRRNTHRYRGRVAMTSPDTGETWTYGQLGDRVDAIAAGLAERGVRPGDVVAYQLFNGPEFAQLYLATQAAAAVGSPMNFRLAAGETAFILEANTPTVFVYDTDLTPMVSDALARASHTPAVLVAVGDGEPVTAPGAQSLRWDELASSTPPPEVPHTAWDETTRLFTSGTTGMPKGVPLNSTAEILSAHDVIMHVPLAPEDTTLNMTPWFHRGGLYCAGPNPTFYLGSSLVPMRTFDPETTLDWVQEYGITFLIGAPTNLAMLAAAQEAKARDLSSLRGIVTMGAPLEREAALRYQQVLNPRIFNGYGSTEGFWSTFLRPSDLPDMAGTAGRACIDDDVLVLEVFGDRLAHPHETVPRDGTTVGEVAIRSPKGALAYVDSPEQEKAKYHDGWLHIGDLATWDENEFVTIVGRKDDMLISGGENVHPVQVEEALNAHPSVADSLVVGVPDDKWGQLVVAYIVPADPESTGDADTLDAHCRRHPMLSTFKRPRAYRFVDSLPVSATGKKLHYKASASAREEMASGGFTTPSSLASPTA
ncbi:AMP-binding protein [Rhodococcus sp. HNM0569]|uniref:class I adenylate-forming enzyme family protein n=1 Tax=Rhodococcus sp. HNM0569 TaxID=2716340 RepID=UPI00146C3893|nr:AMP-binding protein [Rhodococcus sp. HNM0569]NLU83630.1 AMP-binding protein [Rhodococcus sp. HNM0569]